MMESQAPKEITLSDMAISREKVHESLSIHLIPAPLFKRTFAYIVDLGIVSTLLYGLGALLLFMLAGAFGLGAFLDEYFNHFLKDTFSGSGFWMAAILGAIILLFLMSLYDGYFIYFETKRGATPGKKLFGLQVIALGQSKIRLGQAFTRAALRYIDCMLIVPGLVSILLSRRKQRLGDYLASTMVIYSKNKETAQDHLYIDAQSYDMLTAILQPMVVPDPVRTSYLGWAYPRFVLKTKPVDPTEAEAWREQLLHFKKGALPTHLDTQGVLLFFAEWCFQSQNQTQ